ncbi:gluconokinase [Agromyces ramosus]|uniref:Gluconokinase n=1 Tax=Agromyces ramosus TaxID=33879 RepID=A0ABU0R4E0_9MICO|nr:gluconokinase [Agromyces ramosus]MDQ0892940.1 gluconokinase [Agromyces ramosus]
MSAASVTVPRVVVMGPSGAGKSRIGAALADRLAARFPALDFIDSDALHPESNVEKMRAGVPLDDDDRAPWLLLVGESLTEGRGGRVIACSALRRAYRDLIRRGCPDAAFIELVVPLDELADRVAHRPGHFMPAALLSSQLDALEPLGDDERGARVENSGDVDTVVARAIAALQPGW